MKLRVSFRRGIVNYWHTEQNAANWQIKFPWNRPIFSERTGSRQPVFTFLGFRIFRPKAFNLPEGVGL